MKESEATERDIQQLASKFLKELTEDDLRYARDSERGEYRGFAALHDLMDANVVLDSVLRGARHTVDQRRDGDGDEARVGLMNRVMDEVNRVMLVLQSHDCEENAVSYTSDGALGHGFECGVCGTFLQAG